MINKNTLKYKTEICIIYRWRARIIQHWGTFREIIVCDSVMKCNKLWRMRHYRTFYSMIIEQVSFLHLNAGLKTLALRCVCVCVYATDLIVSTARKQITWSFSGLMSCLSLALQKSCSCTHAFWLLLLIPVSFLFGSWSSCTRWASAPERTAWGSSPSTSGTCSWPAATWSDGRGRKGPAPGDRERPPAGTERDECDVFLADF